ncbi:glycosyl hydrolase 115 family protein [Xylanibacter ruminicola]|uniref:Glycosyl hydrolase family 115 n=1 Tax=Xylanibacter ruminicola TaxID=839 RepID=A0A1M6T516_XYLRU|nr:glycosyl hydrolase 115 family protein [Xylanibacter ruminicola]SHK52047.1 Glycosyl hydrolase family 115 [Xylanibacter ruminicola]
MKRIALLLSVFFVAISINAEVVWFDGKSPITYSTPKKVEPVVKIALDMWKSDMMQVTGMEPVASAKSTIKITQGKGAADGFHIYVKDGQIIVEGNNGRGMAYGLLELSRLAGVSPWIWWGDVKPEKKSCLALPADFKTAQQPSVAYRGIFLNDEDWSLRPWSSNTFEPNNKGTIGIQTYKKIFQLLLRLRANAIWPAMHSGTTAFFKIPGAKAMADSCGIVIGTSHCEPLLRNNVDEWNVKQRGAFNYRTNREAVQKYWIERLQEVKHSKDNMFTIGMRGIHDSSMEGYQTEQEKLEALQQVIDDQQELLRKYIGNPQKLMQVFVPYKEVLQLYEKGLKVPDYVTLMWCDDNYGYMTRLSDAQEQQRGGGSGVYYHLSYWGRPHDYLWLTTTQPGLIYNEMRQAYDYNVRRLWIANVHDPKVAGYQLELFLDMAWNINCVNGDTLNHHYRSWLCREFGTEAGQQIFPIMHEFYHLCGQRRPEFMGYTQVELDKKKYPRGLSPVSEVPLTAIEAARRVSAFEHLKADIIAVRPLIRQSLRDAFFAIIEYPVFATAAMNRKILSDSVQSQRAYNEIQQLTQHYNEMNHGKWHHLMDAAPRRLPVFDNVCAQLTGKPVDYVCKMNACDYTEASTSVKTIQMLGHSMNAVALPKDGTLTYRFTTEKKGEYLLQLALIPTQPNDHGDLRFSVAIDGGAPTVFNLKEPFRSEQWKQNVLRGQALRKLKTQLSSGSHTLTIQALDHHFVLDQIMIVCNGCPRHM